MFACPFALPHAWLLPSGRSGIFSPPNGHRRLAAPLKMSSVVLASQTIPAGKKSDGPLIHDGGELVPNLTHVFLQGQTLHLLYEVYDPGHVAWAEHPVAGANASESQPESALVFTSVELLSGGVIAYETPRVKATVVNEPARDAIAFQFDVPLARLKPGPYIYQVNVIDDAGGAYSFPRTAVLIRDNSEHAVSAATP